MTQRRILRLFALVGVLALVGAACSNNNDNTSGDTGGASGATGGGIDCDTVEFGCVQVAAGAPIKVGTLLAISGDTASLGQDSQNGATLAIDYLDGTLDGNLDGEVDGHTVVLSNEDDLCSADGGQAGATALAADPDIAAVIGTSCSSAALGVADKIQGAIVSDFVYTEKGITTAATINDESPYADGLAEAFRNNFEAAGGSITSVEAINSGDTDFKPLLTSIAEKNPGALYFPDFNPACALIAKQAADIMPDTLLIGSDGCLATDFLQTAGSAANGVFASSPDLSVFANGDFYKNEFIPAYKTEFGTAPTSVFHAHAFDAMNILFEAIKTAAVQNSDGSLTIPRQALRDAIFATSGWDGITGTITCNELGDCATDVTIGIFEAPGWPVEGGSGNQDPVFSETKTLDDVL